MADPVERVRIEADNRQANKAAGDVEKRLGQMFDKSALKAAAFNQVLALGTRAMFELGNAVRQGLKDAILYEKTTNTLAAALRATGHEVDQNVKALNAQSAEMQYQVGVSDEVIRSQQTMAISFGVSADKATDFVKAASVMAKMAGQDLKEAMRALLQAQNGVLTETSRLIPAFNELSKEELAAADAAEVVLNSYGDLLTADMDGVAGSVERLALAWGDMGEAFTQIALASGAPTVMDNITASLQRATSVLEQIKDLNPAAIIRGYAAALMAPVEIALAAAGIESPLSMLTGGGGGGGGAPTGPGGGGDGAIDFGGKNGVSPGTIGGGRKRGGGQKFRKMSGGESHGGFGEERIYLDDGSWVLLEEYTAGQNLRYETTAEANAQLAQLGEDQHAYQLGLETERTAFLKTQTDARARIEEQSYGRTAKAAIGATTTALGAINAFAEGGILGALQYGLAMVSSYGMQSIASGTAHEALAASLAMIPGMQAFAAGLAATAANEIAVGTAMAAGGQIAGAGLSLGRKAASGGFANFNVLTGPGGPAELTEEEKWQEQADTAARKKEWEESHGYGSGGGGGSRGSSAFAGGTGYSSGGGGGGGEDRSITVILQGPVYDGAQAGRAIMEKISEAQRQGL